MKRSLIATILFLLAAEVVATAQTPQATEMPGSVFSIRKTWTIGGDGNWDYLTLDPSALRLYIAHGPTVQVVDVNEGKVIGEVPGLRDAHEIALDDQGQYGYVSDGPADDVKVFDRESLEIVAKIPTGRNPRALVYEPSTHLVFVVCPDTTSQESKIPRVNPAGQRITQSDPFAKSTVSVIDADKATHIADILIRGKLGFAQTDGKGNVFINVTDRNQIVSFNANGIDPRARHAAATANAAAASASAGGHASHIADSVLAIDLTDTTHGEQPFSRSLHTFPLGQTCQAPRGLSIDSANERLFVACDNMKMQVLNSSSGDVVATLPIGAGTDAIGYDANHGLIYASNGGGVGSLTIIRQHLSDSYAVIQELPTQARARTLAVNPNTGEVYLVTNVTGFDMTHKGGVGDLKPAALQGSFQVLVVGN